MPLNVLADLRNEERCLISFTQWSVSQIDGSPAIASYYGLNFSPTTLAPPHMQPVHPPSGKGMRLFWVCDTRRKAARSGEGVEFLVQATPGLARHEISDTVGDTQTIKQRK